MSKVTVSAKGQIVLPVALRRRFRIAAGSTIEIIEEEDSLRLRVVRPSEGADVSGLAGLVKAPSRGVLRRLADFDGQAAFETRAASGDPDRALALLDKLDQAG